MFTGVKKIFKNTLGKTYLIGYKTYSQYIKINYVSKY